MSSNVKETVTTLVSDKLIQYMDAAEKVITQYGGDAVHLGLNVLRIEVLSNLFLMLYVIPLLLVAYWVRPKPSGVPMSIPREKIEALIKKGYGSRSGAEDRIVASATGSRSTNTVPADLDERMAGNQIDWSQEESWIRLIVVTTCTVATIPILSKSILDVWNWVGLFWPEAYAVHKFLM